MSHFGTAVTADVTTLSSSSLVMSCPVLASLLTLLSLSFFLWEMGVNIVPTSYVAGGIKLADIHIHLAAGT